jgi:hypothetical protein
MKIEIEKYILKNKDNLRIAATVGEAWPEVMEKLAGGFLDQLDSRLMRKLKGWKFARWERFLLIRIRNTISGNRRGMSSITWPFSSVTTAAK